MIASKVAPYIRHRPKPRNVPDYLIYEIMDGKPIYYRGFREVLSGKKQAEEIMGSSLLQSYIVTYLTSKIINLYCKNFTINNKEIISRDFIRLMKAQKGATVDWVDSFIELND